jgi:serine/threonine protein kinase
MNQIIPQRVVVGIFRAIVDVLEFLAKRGTCHGNVKAGSILFDEFGNPKLIDSYFINGGKTAYELVLENPSSMSLLAPEQMEHIKHRSF